MALYGQEISTISSGNHINIFDVDSVVTVANGEVKALLDWMALHPSSGGGHAVLQFNHPRGGVGEPKDYGRDEYDLEREWVEALDPHVELIEVLNAPALKDGMGFRSHHYEREYFGYLNLGFHISPKGLLSGRIAMSAIDARRAWRLSRAWSVQSTGSRSPAGPHHPLPLDRAHRSRQGAQSAERGNSDYGPRHRRLGS